MEKIETKYQNLACSLYDQLEAFATKRERCHIRYMNGNEIQIMSGIIVDLFSKDGAEYLKLNTSEIIRLDHLVDVNGIPMNTKSC